MALSIAAVLTLFGVLALRAYLSRTSRAEIPEAQFARHVERRIHLHLHPLGYRYDLPKGTLRLPQPYIPMPVPLAELRDKWERPVDAALSLQRTPGGILVTGTNPFSKLRLFLDQSASKSSRHEAVFPCPPLGSDAPSMFFQGEVKPLPPKIRALLRPDASKNDRQFLERYPMDLVVQPLEDGSLKIFGAGAALVTADFPSGGDWLDLDDAKVAAAYMSAYSMNAEHPEFTLVREHSPAVLLFVSDGRVGLLENLGPSAPGAKDTRLRFQLLPGWAR